MKKVQDKSQLTDQSTNDSGYAVLATAIGRAAARIAAGVESCSAQDQKSIEDSDDQKS